MIAFLKTHKYGLILTILLIISIIMSHNVHNNNTINNSILVNTNNSIIDSLSNVVNTRNKTIIKLDSTIKNNDNSNKIVIKYEKIYDKISISNDTTQLSILKDLISRHKQVKLQRN